MEEKPAGVNFKNLYVREYQGHKKKVHSVAWNCVGTKVASGSVDHTARVWNIDPHGHGKVKDVELKGHTDSVDQLCWDPKHTELVATAAGDKTVRLWDARSGKCSQQAELSGENINITYNPDGTHIAVGNKEDELTILDVRKFKPIHRRKFNYEVNEIAWNTTGDLFFLTTGNGTVEVLSYPSLKVQHTLMAHTAGCYCIAIDPTGRKANSGIGIRSAGPNPIWISGVGQSHSILKRSWPVQMLRLESPPSALHLFEENKGEGRGGGGGGGEGVRRRQMVAMVASMAALLLPSRATMAAESEAASLIPELQWQRQQGINGGRTTAEEEEVVENGGKWRHRRCHQQALGGEAEEEELQVKTPLRWKVKGQDTLLLAVLILSRASGILKRCCVSEHLQIFNGL